MAPPKRLLVVDPDPATAQLLAPALRRAGWQVFPAHDAATALPLAIHRVPDLVLLAGGGGPLGAAVFARILASNPRTAHVPILVAGAEGAGLPERRHARADQGPGAGGAAGEGAPPAAPVEHVGLPLIAEEVVARADQLHRRSAAAQALRAAPAAGALEGDLAELPLPDLLQVLGQGRKSGRLAVRRDGATAELFLADGALVAAASGTSGGEQVVFGLLAGSGGRFDFRPAPPGAAPAPPAASRIARRLEELLLEGLRLADEAAARARSGPQAAGAGSRSGAPSGAASARPAAGPGTGPGAGTGAGRPHGAAAPSGAPPDPGLGLDAAALHRLRARLAAGPAGGAASGGKLLLLGGGREGAAAALSRLSGVPGFTAEGSPPPLGTVGRLSLGDGLAVDVVRLPLSPALYPAFAAFAAGALGALLLLPAEAFSAAHAAALLDRGIGLVPCGPPGAPLPPVLEEAGAAASPRLEDPAAALRALLAGAGEGGGTRFAPP